MNCWKQAWRPSCLPKYNATSAGSGCTFHDPQSIRRCRTLTRGEQMTARDKNGDRTRSEKGVSRRSFLKAGAAAAGAAAGSGVITGFPTIWAQEIKDIE